MRTANILIVDDHEDSAEMMAELLRREGHRVRTAWDAFRALQLLEDEPATVVLLDIAMPGMDGYGLAREIKEKYGQSKLIAISGFTGEQHRERALKSGIDETLTKPVKVERLLPVLDRLLA